MSKRTVHIVEDDDIIHLLTYNIKAGGFNVIGVQEGNEALTLAKNHNPNSQYWASFWRRGDTDHRD